MNLDRLEHDIKSAPTGCFYDEHAKASAMLSRAASTLIDSMRKVELERARELAKMTFQEKVSVWLDWLDSLPPEQKYPLVRHLYDHYHDLAVHLGIDTSRVEPAQLVDSTE